MSVRAHVCAERGAGEESTVLSHLPVDTLASDPPRRVHAAPDVQAGSPGGRAARCRGGPAPAATHS